MMKIIGEVMGNGGPSMTTAVQEITQGSLLVAVSRKIPNAPLKQNMSCTGNIQRDCSKKLSQHLITKYFNSYSVCFTSVVLF